MTLPYQRTLSIRQARQFLLRIASPYGDDGIKRIPREVRREAAALLRHYPGDYEVTLAGTFEEIPQPYQRNNGNGDIANTIRAKDSPSPRPSGKVMVDPPDGWRYGFPRVWDRAKFPDCREWMIKNGYPRRLAELNLPCTFTSIPGEDEK
jgi:hypothetical protein